VSIGFEVNASDGPARQATITTARGSFSTPCFMPVGTRGGVKALTTVDLESLGFEVMLANTYHLMLRPGADVVQELGGIHGFSSWEGHVLTDSGGFQVFSLDPDVDDDGVTFRSVYDGSRHRLTPEDAVRVQEALGADIQMVLDVCTALPAEREVLRLAVERTAAWAKRARAARRRSDQALFGIVQGGTDGALRAESARRTVEIGFDGYAVGGLYVGETRPEMLAALEAALAELPVDRPHYLMGVGDPLAMFEAVARGIDMFDCVLPTRLARHGTALTWQGRLQLRNAAWARFRGPIEEGCRCPTCQRWSRAYLRHLLNVADPTAARLVSIHNLAWMAGLMSEMRLAIAEGRLEALRPRVERAWETRAASGS
jgi:queuine tRNA-ribosyltransferase